MFRRYGIPPDMAETESSAFICLRIHIFLYLYHKMTDMGILFIIVLCVAVVCLAVSPLHWLRRRRNRRAVEIMSGRWRETGRGESDAPSSVLVFGPDNAGYRECRGELETFAYYISHSRLVLCSFGRCVRFRMESTGTPGEFILSPCRGRRCGDKEPVRLHIRRVADW